MGWDVNTWIEGGKDVGLLIVDKTTINTRTWDSSALTLGGAGSSVISGNNASTTTFNDSDFYQVRDTAAGNPQIFINSEIDGIAVDDTDFLQSIEIQFNYRLRMWILGN